MINTGNREKPKKSIVNENGKIWFTKETERKFFFLMTIAMLIAGIFYKCGIL